MSLFGTTPPDEAPSMQSSFARSRQSLFDEEESATQSTSNSLFQDDIARSGAGSPWDMPTPRKQQSRADLVRSLLPASDAPDSYIEIFDTVVRENGSGGKVSSGGAMRVLAAANLDADAQAKIMSIIAPGGGEIALGRNEFNVLLGLVGLAQEGDTVSLDGIDERKRSEFFWSFPVQSLYLPAVCICEPPVPYPQSGPLSLICDRQPHPVDAVVTRHH